MNRDYTVYNDTTTIFTENAFNKIMLLKDKKANSIILNTNAIEGISYKIILTIVNYSDNNYCRFIIIENDKNNNNKSILDVDRYNTDYIYNSTSLLLYRIENFIENSFIELCAHNLDIDVELLDNIYID